MSDDLLRQELLAAFEAEYREHLQAIRAALAAGPVSGAGLRDAFRRAHSLKGAARAVDLLEVEEIAHRLEAVLLQPAEEGRVLSDAAVRIVQHGLDAIEARMRGPGPESGRESGRESGQDPGEEAGPGAGPGSAPGQEPTAPPEPVAAEAVLRVPVADIDRLTDAVHALSEAMQQQEQARGGLVEADAELRQLVRLWDTLPGALPSAAGAEFERRLRQLSRRLGIKLARRRTLDWQLDQATQSLRAQMEQVTLVSADSVFGPLAAMARDLAREAGGEVEIRLEGMELRAERRVLQALRDPAIQLLRNAVGHGLRAGWRTASADAGAACGTIVLAVSLQAGRLELAVDDDGPGPDLRQIERTARARGLLPAQGPVPEERQLLSLVFEPGFSTAATVDRLSGRGMGLSIVAEAASRLHGSARMAARRDSSGRLLGTELLVSVPLAARRQALLLVEAAGHLFGLPGSAIERLLRIPASRIEWLAEGPVARFGAGREPLPLVSLGRLLDGSDPLRPEGGDGAGAALSVALVAVAGRRCGVVVERLHDVRTLMVRAADLVGLDRRLAAGIALVEQDRPVLVLQPDRLLSSLLADTVAAGPAPAPSVGGSPVRAQATILVVDDSITTRTLEKTILQAQGYRVLIAVDGMEALSVLRTAQWDVDVVVADVEMPRLDGFGLLAAMQADPRLAAIPTVLMTSRNGEADVRRGLELGARAYITKQDFDQGALLATIGQLLP